MKNTDTLTGIGKVDNLGRIVIPIALLRYSDGICSLVISCQMLENLKTDDVVGLEVKNIKESFKYIWLFIGWVKILFNCERGK